MPSAMIEIKNLTFAYRGQPPVFEGFHLQINRGQAYAVIGPSGCGKTTLLYLLAGLLSPTAGQILVASSPITRPRPQTGLILQDHGLLPWATVQENAQLGLTIRKFYGPDGKHTPKNAIIDKTTAGGIVRHWLKRLGIDELHDKYPSQLSTGQRQRTAIARTLVLEPDLLLMDEPFSALDAAIREDLQMTVIELYNESDLTSIIVTHDIDEAILVGKTIVVLSDSPVREAHIIQNSIAGRPDYRRQPVFVVLREELRVLLGRPT
jgi:NitT/TauT family transport system ATP-binding protein